MSGLDLIQLKYLLIKELKIQLCKCIKKKLALPNDFNCLLVF